VKTRVVLLAAVVLAAAGTAVVLLSGSPESTADSPVATATVKVRDLTRTETLNGVVAYQDMRGLSSPKTGVITWLPAVGADITSGQPLMSVDAQPVILLHGALPAWRDLAPGMSDGPDVQQLEAALLALGYGAKSAHYPDGHWGWQTTDAVDAFQEKSGMPDDGVLSLGEVVFTSGDVHVAKLDGHVGGQNAPGAAVLTVQSTQRVVVLEVDPVKRDLVPQGAPVDVELPSGDRIPGKITSVSTTLVQNADGKPVYQVTVALDDPKQVADIALAPVTVHYVTTVAKQVLTVPVSAIVGVPGGGYAVDVVMKGATKRVAVELGAWGDGYVAVTGDLKPGATVEVPV
jgi:peptidoglycan hydrolase-like protein with peptidoglycan-binding domain